MKLLVQGLNLTSVEIDRIQRHTDEVTDATQNLFLRMSEIKRQLVKLADQLVDSAEEFHDDLAALADHFASVETSRFTEKDLEDYANFNSFFQGIAGFIKVDEHYPRFKDANTRNQSLFNAGYDLGSNNPSVSINLVIPAILWELKYSSPEDRAPRLEQLIDELTAVADFFTPQQSGMFDAINYLVKFEKAQLGMSQAPTFGLSSSAQIAEPLHSRDQDTNSSRPSGPSHSH